MEVLLVLPTLSGTSRADQMETEVKVLRKELETVQLQAEAKRREQQ